MTCSSSAPMPAPRAFVALSSNGTLIDEGNIQQIADARFDYVGISIDGLKATHDAFRQCEGSFERSMHAISLCRQAGIRVGLRTTPDPGKPRAVAATAGADARIRCAEVLPLRTSTTARGSAALRILTPISR